MSELEVSIPLCFIYLFLYEITIFITGAEDESYSQ